MAKTCGCACNQAPTLIFACSGSADVGELADRAARKLDKDGIGHMYCLAGVGGRVSGIMKSTEGAVAILAIDGCPLNCAKNCLEQANFKDYYHVRVADLGFAKGETKVSDESIGMVANKGYELLKEIFGELIP